MATKRLKKFVVSSVGLLLLISQTSYGFIIIDGMKLAKWMHESTHEYQKYVEMFQSLQRKFQLNGKAGNAEVEAMQNNTANKIVRETQNRIHLFNQQLKMGMLPDPNACSSYNISQTLANYQCAFLSRVHQASTASTTGLLSGSKQNGFGDTPYTYMKTKHLGGLSEQQMQAVTSAATFENINEKTLTPEQSSEAKSFIYLVAPKPNLIYDPRVEATLIGQRLKTKRLTAIARAQAPTNVLNNVILANESTNGGPSIERLISQTGQEFIINPKNILALNQGGKMTPDAIMRARAVAAAYKNYLLVQQYQADLKKEFMYSNMLILLQGKDIATGDISS